MGKINRNLYYCDRTPMRKRYLALCLSNKAFHAELARLKVQVAPDAHFTRAGAVGTTWTFEQRATGESLYVVTMQEQPEVTLLQYIGLLIHEATHVWQGECEEMGESAPGREVEAYSIQAIAQSLIEAYVRLRPKCKMVARPVAD